MLLAEELLLLAIDNEKGRIRPKAIGSLASALPASLVAELYLRKRITIAPDGSFQAPVASVTDELPLVRALETLIRSKPGTPIQQATRSIMLKQPMLVKELLEQMSRRGEIRKEERRMLLIFPANQYFARSDQQLAELSRNLKRTAESFDRAKQRDQFLIVLAAGSGLLNGIVSDQQIADVKEKATRCETLSLVAGAAKEENRAIAGDDGGVWMLPILLSTSSGDDNSSGGDSGWGGDGGGDGGGGGGD